MTSASPPRPGDPKPGVEPLIVVDDDEPTRSALVRFLTTEGYDVRGAGSGPEALEALRNRPASLMLLDVSMPGMTGIAVVPEALAIAPDLAIVMLTGLNDATTAAQCLQRGATDYLTKPVELTELSHAVRRALRRRDTALQTKGITDWLEEEAARRAAEVERERLKHRQLTLATLEALVNALEAKSPFLRGHSARVAALSGTIAHEMGLDDARVDEIRMAGRLHDLGMIGIREDLLNRAGPLTPEEYEHVKDHVVIGAQILAPLSGLGPVVSYVRTHHERWDGKGYPDGLAGEDIPLGGRIIHAAEAWDALTTSRPYQKRLEPEEAVARLRAEEGTAFDPRVVEALSAAVARRQALVFLDEGPLPPV